jgi:hypothetical protein
MYVEQKMRSEKMVVQVGKSVEDFLNGLEKPLQLNEMRVMKESNYVSTIGYLIILNRKYSEKS